MRLWIDTEFNSFNGELISLALVSEEESVAFYEVLDYSHMDIHPWVAEHVIPFLEKEPISRDEFMERLYCFLYGCTPARGPVTIISDWCEDLEHFLRLLVTGPGERMSTPDFTFELISWLNGDSAVPHNAYHDAIGNREHYLAVMGGSD